MRIAIENIVEHQRGFVDLIYDEQIFGMQEYGGISRYVCEVASRIHRQRELHVRVVAPLFTNKYLRICRSNGLPVVGRYVRKYPKTRACNQSSEFDAGRSFDRKKQSPDYPPDILFADPITVVSRPSGAYSARHDAGNPARVR